MSYPEYYHKDAPNCPICGGAKMKVFARSEDGTKRIALFYESPYGNESLFCIYCEVCSIQFFHEHEMMQRD